MNPILLTLGQSIDSTFLNFDLWVFRFFGEMQNAFLTIVAKMFTTFGDEAFMVPMVVVGIVMCFFKKTRKYGFSIIFAVLVGTIVTNVVAKPMFLRVRPYNTLQNNPIWPEFEKWYAGVGSLSESDYSFPSGHTTGATELAIAMFLCFRSDKKKIAYIFPFIALCTAGSRVYLMVHYASDVCGGLIVGCIAGVLGYLLMKLVMLLFTKTGADDKIDVGRLFNKMDDKKRGKLRTVAAVVAVLGVYLYAFIPSLSEGGAQICAYNGDYNCYNAARIDDEKYPAIDGKEYCKIHWKELSGK